MAGIILSVPRVITQSLLYNSVRRYRREAQRDWVTHPRLHVWEEVAEPGFESHIWLPCVLVTHTPPCQVQVFFPISYYFSIHSVSFGLTVAILLDNEKYSMSLAHRNLLSILLNKLDELSICLQFLGPHKKCCKKIFFVYSVMWMLFSLRPRFSIERLLGPSAWTFDILIDVGLLLNTIALNTLC